MKNISDESAVLFIIYNRAEYAEKVFQAIRKAKPKKLYISADGPKNNNQEDLLKCENTRNVVKNIDWECEVFYRLLDYNLGCAGGISSAITWGFEKEDKLIILEDDCVPSLPFFEYCNYCLDKYKYDHRVWMISGRSHHENSEYFNDYDYIFSKHEHSWGWATWKRCWILFDGEMKDWEEFYKSGGFCNTFLSKEEGDYYNKLFKNKINNNIKRIDTYSYPFLMTIQLNSGLTVIPSKNLIENIGVIGSHSSNMLKCHTLKAADNYKIEKEPKYVLSNRVYDLMHFNAIIKKENQNIILKIIKKIFLLFRLK
jgi:hypothetical protein